MHIFKPFEEITRGFSLPSAINYIRKIQASYNNTPTILQIFSFSNINSGPLLHQHKNSVNVALRVELLNLIV